MPRFIQIAAGLNPGDAISNEIRWMLELSRERPFRAFFSESLAFAEHIHPELGFPARPASEYRSRPDDVILLHYGIAAELLQRVDEWRGALFLRYHNVTPSRYFRPYSLSIAGKLERARRELRRLRPYFRQSFADSRFNAEELIELGFASVATVPVLFGERRDPLRPPSGSASVGYRGSSSAGEGLATLPPAARGDGPLVLFVGRLAPNKGHAELLKIFAYLVRILPSARLVIAGGSVPGLSAYESELRLLQKRLGLEGCVAWTGFVSQAELDALYARADLYLSASFHEGFGVPLLEAMQAGAPVLAYGPDDSAVRETMGGAGCLFHALDYPRIAELAATLLVDEGLQAAVVRGQRQRVAEFDPARSFADFYRAVREALPV